MNNQEFKPAGEKWTREEVIAKFPPKPLREKFRSEDEWEEALGRWNSTVGRAIARRLKAFNLPLSPDPAPNIDTSLANSEKNEDAPAEQIPIKQMEMNSPEYHAHFRAILAEALMQAGTRQKAKTDPKT